MTTKSVSSLLPKPTHLSDNWEELYGQTGEFQLRRAIVQQVSVRNGRIETISPPMLGDWEATRIETGTGVTPSAQQTTPKTHQQVRR